MFAPLLQPIIIPLVAGLLCLLLPTRWDRLRAWLTVVATAATLLAVLPLFIGENQTKAFGGLPLLRMDELSGFILLATSVFAFLVAVYSLDYMKGKDGQKIYHASLLGSLALSCGVLLSNDLI